MLPHIHYQLATCALANWTWRSRQDDASLPEYVATHSHPTGYLRPCELDTLDRKTSQAASLTVFIICNTCIGFEKQKQDVLHLFCRDIRLFSFYHCERIWNFDGFLSLVINWGRHNIKPENRCSLQKKRWQTKDAHLPTDNDFISPFISDLLKASLSVWHHQPRLQLMSVPWCLLMSAT